MGLRSWKNGGGPRHGGRRRGAHLALVAALLGILLTTQISSASHATVFELEGDMIDSPAGPPSDWTTFFSGSGGRITPLPAGFKDSGFDSDYAFPDTSTFTSGSKDTLDVSAWSCTDSNNLGGKFDIINSFSAIYEVPANTGSYSAGDVLLFFGIERAATEGDGAMGFWFLKDSGADCEKTQNGKAPAFTGTHKNGDIFVAAGFSNGGTSASVTAYEWKGGDANGFLDVDNPLVTGALCSGNSENACGIVNTAEIATPAGKPWPSPDKNGGNLDVNAFYEGFVRVPASEVSGCFATFVANTRSSTSPTATIMDFSRGSFPTCRPSTTMIGQATPSVSSPEVVVGGSTNPDQVTYTFRETNDGNTALTNVYVVTNNTACNNALTPASVANLAQGATAVFSCTLNASAAAGTTTIRAVGHGTSVFGDVTVCGADALPFPAPANALCDSDEQDSAKSVTIIPGTDLTVAANTTTAKVGGTASFTITETNDGSAPAGFEGSLALGNVGVSSPNADCDAELADSSGAPDSKAGGDTDNLLEPNETWTWTCSVTVADGNDVSVQATGTGTVLTGTSRQRTVTWCTDPQNPPAGTFCDQEERASASVDVISPGTSLTVTASALVTYTFVESNEGDVPLSPPTPGSRNSFISLAQASVCNSAPAYQSGDTNGDSKLDTTEDWTFTCQGTLNGPSADTGSNSVTADGRGHGKDSTGADVTWCADPGSPPTSTQCDQRERDRVTVTIENLQQG